MEQDKQLQKILLHGVEIASADFTDAIMKKINILSTNTSYYQPLVSNKIKKAFVLTIAILVSSILLLCLMISSPGLPLISLIKIPLVPVYTGDKILGFLFSFWIVFTINSFITKSKLKSSRV